MRHLNGILPLYGAAHKKDAKLIDFAPSSFAAIYLLVLRPRDLPAPKIGGMAVNCI